VWVAPSLFTLLIAACLMSPSPSGDYRPTGDVTNMNEVDVPNSNSSADSPADGDVAPSSIGAASSSEGNNKIPISIETVAGAGTQLAYLVPPLRQPSNEQIVRAIEASGFPCGSGVGIHQLEQKGERLDVYKVDCSAGSYQLTEMNGNAFIKPWTGVMMGQ
jgi:hypothetical protein